MILTGSEFEFDFVKQVFKVINLDLSIDIHPELSFDEKKNYILQDFKILVSELDDILLHAKKIVKKPKGKEYTDYIRAGYSYETSTYKHYMATSLEYIFYKGNDSITKPRFTICLDSRNNTNYYIFVYLLHFLDEKISYVSKKAISSILRMENNIQNIKELFDTIKLLENYCKLDMTNQKGTNLFSENDLVENTFMLSKHLFPKEDLKKYLKKNLFV